MATILLLHGPNLNLLGMREPEIYGSDTLDIINLHMTQQSQSLGHELPILQSNAEHELINRIHTAKLEGCDFIIFNPAAFTHTSIALRDALLAVGIPFIEVHLSDPSKREAFRQTSYFSDIAVDTISGHGAHSYYLALDNADEYLKQQK